MTSNEETDVVVVGGGPGGSTLATVVAMKGHKVLLLEKEKFPRYQIGESLLPSTLEICEKIGVLKQIEKARFTEKKGGVWYWGINDEPGWGFEFSEIPELRKFGRGWS